MLYFSLIETWSSTWQTRKHLCFTRGVARVGFFYSNQKEKCIPGTVLRIGLNSDRFMLFAGLLDDYI